MKTSDKKLDDIWVTIDEGKYGYEIHVITRIKDKEKEIAFLAEKSIRLHPDKIDGTIVYSLIKKTHEN